MSWHEFGQTALRPRDDTKISYTDALARAREKSLGKILLRLERQRERKRETSFYFATSVFRQPFHGQRDRQTIGVREGNIKWKRRNVECVHHRRRSTLSSHVR